MNSQDTNAEPLEVFFDESGFTGPRLLDPVQRLFSYASVQISDGEAWSILDKARSNNPVQMPELKASKLVASTNGISLMKEVLSAVNGRYSFVLQDKLLILCGKVFEYIYEPVFQFDPALLYEKNLHKFVAMYCYIFFLGPEGEEAIRQFERFMRSLDPDEAPLWFNPDHLNLISDDDPFKIVVKFAQGYKKIIVADNQRMRTETSDAGKWALDVSISGLWSLLNHWGETGRPLRVTCDDSKPLREQVHHLTGDQDDPGIKRALEISGRDEKFGWALDRPIQFGDSRNHPALQIADLIAGCATRTLVLDDDRPELNPIREELWPHAHRHIILPDFEYVQLGTRAADVNWLVLSELAERATIQSNPFMNLKEFYEVAERTWTPDVLGDNKD